MCIRTRKKIVCTFFVLDGCRRRRRRRAQYGYADCWKGIICVVQTHTHQYNRTRMHDAAQSAFNSFAVNMHQMVAFKFSPAFFSLLFLHFQWLSSFYMWMDMLIDSISAKLHNGLKTFNARSCHILKRWFCPVYVCVCVCAARATCEQRKKAQPRIRQSWFCLLFHARF